MDSCDVLIVGGGPAGSTCARKLLRAGLDVVVMDKKNFPRVKVCAGWVTPAVIQTLQLDTADYSRGRTFQPIKGFRIGILGRKQVENLYDRVMSFGILRHEFDDYLLKRCGARLRLGEDFKTIEKIGARWRINGALEAGLVIGAGGHFCPVARFMGAKASGRETVVAAQEVEFEMTEKQIRECKIHPEVPEIYFCEDLKGYAWCFRKGNFLNMGLGREDSASLSEHVKEFLKFAKAQSRVPQDTPEKFHGHAYILYGHTERELLGEGLMLIGDAAGLAYPESGEGIRTAVESGLLAAETIISARGNFSRVNLEPYTKQLVARFGNPKPAETPKGLKASIVKALFGTSWFSRHLVVERWFLHLQQPPLEEAIR